jgi:glucose-1-phosphate adenylyltransferase
MKDVLAMILAGGRGRRLLPLTSDRAKPAVPFGGIYRIIDCTLSNCVNSGILKINVLTQYKSISLNRHLKRGWSFLPPEMGQYIDAIPAQQRLGENWYRGTADAIYQNIYSIEKESCGLILVLAGDHIYKMDYSKLVQAHRESKASVTVCAYEVPASKSHHFGIFDVDSNGRITGFREKPSEAEPIPGTDRVLASMGIYLFDTKMVVEKLPALVEAGGFDFGRDIIPTLLESEKVSIYKFHTFRDDEEWYWRDVGTIDAYWEANMDLVAIKPTFNLYDEEWPLRTYHGDYPPAKFVYSGSGEGDRLGIAVDCIVSAGCVISGGRVQNSVLSPYVRINSYSHVFESILMERVDVGRYAKLRRVIVDKDVNIPPETQIGYNLQLDRQRFTVTDSGTVVVPKGYVFE